MSRQKNFVDSTPSVIIEGLDPFAMTAISRLRLPLTGCDLRWDVMDARSRTPLREGQLVVVVSGGDTFIPTGTDEYVRLVAKRVAKYRAAGQTAVGICVGSPNEPLPPVNGILRVSSGRWERDLRKMLMLLSSVFCERQPQATVGIDWSDVIDILDCPGELYLEWAQDLNDMAVRTVLTRFSQRMTGRKCGAILFRLGGGKNRWFNALKVASSASRNLLKPNGLLLRGDSVALFRGRPGCCLLAVAD